MASKLKGLCLPALIAAGLCGIAVFLILNAPSMVGLANNGDFTRVIGANGIAYVNGDPAKDRFTPYFRMTIRGDSRVQRLASLLQSDYSTFDYVSSQSLAVKASKLLNYAWNKLRHTDVSNYNIVWLGIIYITGFAVALYLIFSFVFRRFGRGAFAFAALAGLFVFCDQGYALYFNSFYGEAAQYVGTMLSVGLFLRLCEKPSRHFADYALFYAAVVFMGMSKYAYAPVGVLFALLPLTLWKGFAFPKRRAVVMAGTVALGLVMFSAWFTPPWIEKDTNCDAVFAGVLKYSDTPERDLDELGLNPEYAALKGWEAYQTDYPIDVQSAEFKEGFYENISKGKILTFYLKHPSRLFQAMKIEAQYAKNIRPAHLTNTQNPASPREQSRRFSLWETVRGAVGVNSLWAVFALFAVVIGTVIREIIITKRNKSREGIWPLAALMAAITAAAGFNFVIPYISNGVCDIAKHMFGFVESQDVLIVAVIGYWGRFLFRLCQKRFSSKNISA